MSGKDPICQCRRHKRCGFDPWVGNTLWRRAWQPTLAFLPGEFHGWGAWWAIVTRVTKNRTWPKQLSTTYLSSLICEMGLWYLILWNCSEDQKKLHIWEQCCNRNVEHYFNSNSMQQHLCLFYPWIKKIPWRREWQPTPVFLPGEFHRQRSLTGVAKSWTWLSKQARMQPTSTRFWRVTYPILPESFIFF